MGPSSTLLETDQVMVKITFSRLLQAIYCIPLVIIEGCCSATPYKELLKKTFTCKIIGLMVLAAFFQAIVTFGLYYGA